MEALIFNGMVVQIESKIFPVHNTLEWVDTTGITPSPKVGWFYNGAIFSPPPTPTPEPLPTNSELYDQNIKQNKVFKAYVLAVNKGTIVPGSNMSGAAIKTAVEDEM